MKHSHLFYITGVTLFLPTEEAKFERFATLMTWVFRNLDVILLGIWIFLFSYFAEIMVLNRLKSFSLLKLSVIMRK